MFASFSPSKHLWYSTNPPQVMMWMVWWIWDVKDVNTRTLSSSGASSVSRKPGSLSLSWYLLYVKLRWLMAQIYIDEEFSFFFCLFASHILWKSSAARSYCFSFVHTSLIVYVYTCVYLCTWSLEISVMCFSPITHYFIFEDRVHFAESILHQYN